LAGFSYRSFDDLGVLDSAKADPEGFVASLGDRAVLDEIQRVPELLMPIKASVDRDRRPGRFVLTGSANVLTLPRVSESLAGRMEVLPLWPLSQAEMAGVDPGFLDACFQGRPQSLKWVQSDRQDLVDRAIRGGYPEVVARADPEARTRWFDAYLTTLIQRDLRDLSQLEGIAHLPRLLQGVAQRAGSPMNIADLGRTLGMNQVTLKRHMTLLETIFLMVQLPPWFDNLGKRLAKTPKVYFNDSGLLAHLLGLEPEGFSVLPAQFGAVLENFVVMELAKMAGQVRARPALLHMRTSDGAEVDIVLENRRRDIVGLEVKAAVTVSESDFKSLRMFQSALGARMKCGVVLYAGREALPFGPGLWAMPVQSLWGT
jgi:predicted AAA+ superfamily ATPase